MTFDALAIDLMVGCVVWRALYAPIRCALLLLRPLQPSVCHSMDSIEHIYGDCTVIMQARARFLGSFGLSLVIGVTHSLLAHMRRALCTLRCSLTFVLPARWFSVILISIGSTISSEKATLLALVPTSDSGMTPVPILK